MGALPPRKNQPGAGEGGRRNTLGLKPRDLMNLLDQFDAGASAKPDPNREFIRWPFRKDSVEVIIEHAGGSTASILMACRNISRSGLSLLHSCYMHPGTKCTVMLPHPDKGVTAVPGWIARCHHRSGVVHEIGMSFKTPIDIREWLRADAFSECYSLEAVDPEQLKGSILYVDDSEMDVRIFKHFLRGTSLVVRSAPDSAGALASLGTAHDIIVTDLRLPDSSGADLVRALRQRVRTPIILVTSDTGEESRALIKAAQPDACIAKPLNQLVLLRAIAEFLIVNRSGPARDSAAGGDQETASLVQGFLSTLPQVITGLENGIETRNLPQVRSACLQLAGTAPTLGFHHLGEAAREASKALERTKNVAESLKTLRALVSACERIRAQAA